MRITSKDQKVVRAQQQSATTPSTTQPDALIEGSAAVCGVPPQAQPLQARSSNSGTSVKRSDNISQSSYPHGDISSDKPGQCSAAWTKTSSTSTTLQQSQHQQQIMPSQLAIGQTTSAFAQKRGDAADTPTASTANTKNAETATALIGSSSASLVNKRSGNSRRAATSSAATANQDHSLSSTASGQQDRAVNQSGAQPATSRVSTRASGRQTRQSDQRAVKDSPSAQQQLHQQQPHLKSNSNCNQAHPQQSSSDADAILGTPTSGCGSKPAQMVMTMQHQVGSGAQSLNNSTLNAGDSSLLKPVKQSCSEQQVSTSMRTTRSKAKAKQQDVKNIGSGQAGAGAAASIRQAQVSSSVENNHISNGQQQSEAQRAPQSVKDNMDGEDHVMNTGKEQAVDEAAQVEDSEQILNISAVDGNLEKAVNKTQIDLKTSKRNQNDMSHQAWHVAEESKLQSPRSSLNSTLIAAVAGAENKPVNQSFRINDSTDSLLENPLTTVIKQFQNLRTNAQLTGKNKPTIQQFLEKFEKEMQYLEDQYQAQQQAREEQMRLFEQHYGGKQPVDQFQTLNGKLPSGKPATGHPASGGHSTSHQQPYLSHQQPHHHPNSNDQVVASAAALVGQFSHRAGQNQQLPSDSLMVQDTATLGPMPHNEQSNNNNNISFNSVMHGPNAQSILGGTGSDITHNAEVYESFSFTQNSMLQFYPRQVRKILTRRKTTNSANTIMTELKDLKAPKHKLKTKKTMTKMQSLAICQMNMMQILLQKISRRSKVIRKQEKLVNDNLKRKRIYLERDRFDLMSVLRKSLEVTEERELLQRQSLQQQQHQHQQPHQPAVVNGAANGFSAQQALGGALAQKNKTQQTTMRATTTGVSDLNSNCLSMSGTKYGADQPNTQSIRGSTAAPIFGDENTSMDGFASRKQTRLQSGAENCLSVAADSVSYKAMHNMMEGSVKAQQATPEPPSKKPTAVSNNVGVCGEEDLQGDQHQVSHIMDKVVGGKDLAGEAEDQIFAPNTHINTSNLMQTPPKINAQSRQISGNCRFNSNNAIALQQQMGVARDGADSLFDYDQQQQPQQVAPAEPEATERTQLLAHPRNAYGAEYIYGRRPEATTMARQPVRKMQSTQGKQRKRKSNNLIANQAGGDGADNTNLSMISHVGQAPPQLLNLEMESMAGENGSFAIADLQQPHIKTEHLPDGNFAITIKKSTSDSAAITQQQPAAQFSGNTRQPSAKTGAVAGGQTGRSKRRQAYGTGSMTCPTLSIDTHAANNTTSLGTKNNKNNNSSRQNKDSAAITQQQVVETRECGMEGVVVMQAEKNVMNQEQHSQQQQQDALIEQQKHDNQRKLSPLRNIGQEHQQQQNATNVNVQSSIPHLQFGSNNIDANNFDFSSSLQQHHHHHHHALSMVGNPDHHHLVDHHMQPEHFMMPPTHAAERGQTHHHHGKSSMYPVYHHHHGHGAPEQVVPGNTAGGPHHYQPLVPQGQIPDLAMHRSQSHLLPSGGHQYHMMEVVDPTINPLVEASNLAGHHHPHHPFDQFAHVHFVDAEEEAGQVAPGNGRGGEQDHRSHPHGTKPKDNHDVLNLNFFDESAQELSSIDHSAAAVDQYGYNSQAGPNPYEQAKRQYLKKSMMAAQQAGVPQTGGVRNAAGATCSDEDVQQPSYIDRVNQFVSPMVVGLQQLSADQHTPQAKVDGHHHHHAEGANQQSAVVDDVDNTPSHFMSGVVDSAVHQAGLGRGTGLGAAQQRRNNAHQQQQQQQQLSVQRICGTANGADPFNMSAASGQHHMGGRGGAQNTFGNTPAGLMSNSQPCITDAHRQHLSVSGWNLVDVDEVETAGHHRQHEEDAHRQQRSHHHHQIYHQTGGLPEHHHHPYM